MPYTGKSQRKKLAGEAGEQLFERIENFSVFPR